MKSYLDLVKISGKVHRKQSLMTRICIFLAVFLVAAIFSMADMEIRAQRISTVKSDGAWHAVFRGLTREQQELIAARPEVEESSWYGATNYRVDMGYQIQGTETVICGFDREFLDLYPSVEIKEGSFPEGTKDGVVLTETAADRLGIGVGDKVTLDTPEGEQLGFTVSGITGDTSSILQQGVYGMFTDREIYQEYFMKDTQELDGEFYVSFTPWCDIQEKIREIRDAYSLSDEQVGQNAKLLALMLQSSAPYIFQLYGTAAVLALLVVLAGVLMISGSLSSNIARRTGFFGMLRCLGAQKRQVVRFVRREALGWCVTAIPLGVLAGVLVTWALCALLRLVSDRFFGDMPVFGVSLPGIAAGAVIGLITVLLAARAPARKASKASPLAAVSGNTGEITRVRRAARTRFFHVDTVLGIHHAKGKKRNFILLSVSFAFSILLFLSFSTAVDFMHHALVPLRPYTPDVSVVSADETCSIPKDLARELEGKDYVKRVYGRSFAYELPAQTGERAGSINLISLEENQLGWAGEGIIKGDIESVEKGDGVMGVYVSEDEGLKLGDVITLETSYGVQKLPVTALTSFSIVGTQQGVENVYCSEALFSQLTGQDGYTIIDVQLAGNATEGDVEEIRSLGGEGTTFSDRRMDNGEVRGVWYSMVIFVYGFLAVIALISMFNIINSIGMSVEARMKQYGAMRAIGMSSGQLIKMVAAEALTYVLSGMLFGCVVGLPLHRLLYQSMITSRWGDEWQIPGTALAVILAVMALSAVLAVWGPARRIRNMSVVDTISAL